MTPSAVPAAHCFYAMAAVLNAAARHSTVVHRVYCPGLCTGIGNVAPSIAAAEMEHAHRKWSEMQHAVGTPKPTR